MLRRAARLRGIVLRQIGPCDVLPRIRPRRTLCTSTPKSAANNTDASKEIPEDREQAVARELVYGEGGEPPKLPYTQVAFTLLVLGTYVAYVKLIEEPAEQAEAALALPEAVVAPLPPGASKRLPDGRLLMADGSIQRPPS
jgi:hypothetical protein